MVLETTLRKVWKIAWILIFFIVDSLIMLRRHPIAQPIVVRNGIFYEMEDGSMCYQYEMLDLQRVMASYQDYHDNYAAEYKIRRFSQDLTYYQQPVWIPEAPLQPYHDVTYVGNENCEGISQKVQDEDDINNTSVHGEDTVPKRYTLTMLLVKMIMLQILNPRIIRRNVVVMTLMSGRHQ